MWLYAIAQMSGGLPQINTGTTPYNGHVLFGQLGQFGLYMFSGTQVQLTAVGTLATVVPLVAVTDNGVVRYPEMGSAVSTAIRTKLNAWLTARGLPNIPAGWTYRRLLDEILGRFGVDTEDGNWVTDGV